MPARGYPRRFPTRLAVDRKQTAGWGRQREGAMPRAEGWTMTAQIAPDHPIRELFGGVLERSFQLHLGVNDPQMTRYLANVMVDFTHRDSIFRIRDARGQRLEEVA